MLVESKHADVNEVAILTCRVVRVAWLCDVTFTAGISSSQFHRDIAS